MSSVKDEQKLWNLSLEEWKLILSFGLVLVVPIWILWSQELSCASSSPAHISPGCGSYLFAEEISSALIWFSAIPSVAKYLFFLLGFVVHSFLFGKLLSGRRVEVSLTAASLYALLVPGVSCFSGNIFAWFFAPLALYFCLKKVSRSLLPENQASSSASFSALLPYLFFALGSALVVWLDGSPAGKEGTLDSHHWPHFIGSSFLLSILFWLRPAVKTGEILLFSWAFAAMWSAAMPVLAFCLSSALVEKLSEIKLRSYGPRESRVFALVLISLALIQIILTPALESQTREGYVGALNRDKPIYAAKEYQNTLLGEGFALTSLSGGCPGQESSQNQALPRSADSKIDWEKELESSPVDQILVLRNSRLAGFLREYIALGNLDWREVELVSSAEAKKAESSKTSSEPRLFKGREVDLRPAYFVRFS